MRPRVIPSLRGLASDCDRTMDAMKFYLERLEENDGDIENVPNEALKDNYERMKQRFFDGYMELYSFRVNLGTIFREKAIREVQEKQLEENKGDKIE